MKRIFLFPTVDEAKGFLLTNPRDPVFVAGEGMAETAAATVRAVKARKPHLAVLCGLADAADDGLRIGEVVEVVSEQEAGFDAEYFADGPQTDLRPAAGLTVTYAAEAAADTGTDDSNAGEAADTDTDQSGAGKAADTGSDESGAGEAADSATGKAADTGSDESGAGEAADSGTVDSNVGVAADTGTDQSGAGEAADSATGKAADTGSDESGAGEAADSGTVDSNVGVAADTGTDKSGAVSASDACDPRTGIATGQAGVHACDDRTAARPNFSQPDATLVAEPPLPLVIEREGAAFFAVCEALGVACGQIRAVAGRTGCPRKEADIALARKNLTETLTRLYDDE